MRANIRKKHQGRSGYSRKNLEQLESRLLMAANPVITEFLAKNASSLVDGNGNNSDWIEIQNQGDASINLQGWHLTDDITKPSKWTFPSYNLATGAYMVVFADSSGAVDAGGNLHTNFSLDTSGEVLALTRTDLTVASQWNANGSPYPAQTTDVSYGNGTIYHNTTLINVGATAKAFVPKNSSLDAGQWTSTTFDDSTWTSGTTGVGYDTGGYEDNSIPPTLLADWNADDLTSLYANNGNVTTWKDNVANRTAIGSASPQLRTNQMNGHAVVHFVSSDQDQFRVAKAVNPMAGLESFTLAVVFRTSTNGVGSQQNWYSNTGIVDAEEGGSTNDWGLAYANTGKLGAGMGAPDTTLYSAASINNNSTHVAVITRSGTSYTLYLDGGNGVSTTVSATARNLADMVFGSIQTNINYFNGDIAEVKVYNGGATVTGAYSIAQGLATKYAAAITAPTNTQANMTADWTADSLNTLASGANVSSWTSAIGTYAANLSSSIAPTLSKTQLAGHSVVHFNGASNTQLRVTSSNNPMASVGDFSLVVVFRTSTAGVAGSQWYSNTPLVDAEEGGVTNDWGLAVNNSGAIGAGIGNPDATIYSGAGLANGNAHIAIYTKSGSSTSLSIDGATPVTGTAGTSNRNFADMVFGSMQTNYNYFTGDLAEVQTYNAALTGDASDALVASLGSKYGITVAPPAYTQYLGLNLQSAMYQQATTADIRIPFTVNNPSQFSRLLLDMQYDDGFVAYLNGTEIARRNSPSGAINYTTTALAVRPQVQALSTEVIDVSSFINLLQGGGATNILAIKALNSSLNDPDLLIRPQLIAATSTTGPAYFSNPTPGAANGEGYQGMLNPVSFSLARGYYTGPQTITLTDSSPGSTIIYTTDGSTPSLINGTIISPSSSTATPSGTVNITTTTTLRAIAVEDAYINSTIGTESYLYTAAVLTQTNTAPAGAYWTTQVDPAIVNAAQTYSVTQALLAIPTMSLALPFSDMFGPNGIYTNPTQRGSQWERETSVEYFDPNNMTDQFQLDAGLRVQGGADRDTYDPKKSFRLFFRGEYGAAKLNYPVFGSSDPQQSFDHILLKAGHNNTWANPGGTPAANGDYIRDQFARDLQQAATGASAEGKWVQLYINGQYWGLYNLTEEPDDNWTSSHFGGSPGDYDVLQPDNTGALEVLSGSGTAYNNLFNTVNTDMADTVISSAEYTTLAPLVDMKGLADYILTVFYRGDEDAPVLIGSSSSPRNFYTFRDAATNGPFEFTTWDGELGMQDVNINRTTLSGNLNPAALFQALKTNIDFATLFTDEAYRLFYNNGPMQSDGTVDNPKAILDNVASQVNVAIVGESARWGYVQSNPSMNRDANWLSIINYFDNTFFPQRSNIFLGQLKSIFPQLQFLPPSFKINGTANRGGQVTLNSLLTLMDINASTSGDQIYYTLNGSDPRTSGAALLYSGPITINNTYTVKVRVKNGTSWSPIDSATYDVHAAAAVGNIAITEFDYHPSNPTAAELAVGPAWTDSDFEFVELTNIGVQTIDLVNAKFDLGVTFTFGNNTLGPGQRVVIVSNPTAFQVRYGNSATIAGTFTGHLSNSTATIELRSASNAVIQNFTYSDSGAWPARADGDGSSLEVVSLAGPYAAAANWRASYECNGTPGTQGNPVTDVVVNEILPAPSNGNQSAIELYNTTGSNINIGGWYLSNTRSNYLRFHVPTNTIIAANGYYVITGADFDPTPANPSVNDIVLNGTVGDNLILLKASASGTLLAFADEQTFGTAAIGESFGRWPNGTGALYPMASNTFGAVNSGPRIGPVTITEFNYNPTAGTTNLQYVELQNQTSATINISGWSFAQGITFTFPSGTTLAPYEAITLVHFDPASDAASLAAFRSAYNLTAANRLIGPFTDKLSKTGEELELVRPDAPRSDNPGYTPLILVDDVNYNSVAPWPVTAVGQPIVRLSNHIYGEDPTNWSATNSSVDQVAYGNAWFEASANYTYASSTNLDTLNLINSAVVNLSTGVILHTGSSSLQSGNVINIGNGSFIIDNAKIAAITALVRSGLNANGALWTGLGINSSAAAGGNLSLNAIGAIPTNGGIGALVKFTYFGDADLNGVVNGNDYTLIDNGFASNGALSGWLNGDFNYDNVIDGSDYSLIDNAFNRQGASLAASPAAEVFAPTQSQKVNAAPVFANGPAITVIAVTRIRVDDLLVSDDPAPADWI